MGRMKESAYGLDGDRDGETYEREFDLDRLNKQCREVYDRMCDGMWHTLRDIADHTGNPEASVSARLRDLRKIKFGGFEVDRKRGEHGLHFYKLVMPEPIPEQGQLL
jgi:hypothetical protein